MTEQIDFSEDAAGEETTPVNDDHLRQLSKLANDQLEAEDLVKKLTDDLANAKSNLDRLSKGAIPDLMDEIGMLEFTLSDGSKIQVVKNIRASIKKENRPQAHKYLKDQGAEALIKRKIEVPFGKGKDELKRAEKLKKFIEENGLKFSEDESTAWNTLTAWVKERMESGKPVDAELLGVWEIKETKIARPS